MGNRSVRRGAVFALLVLVVMGGGTDRIVVGGAPDVEQRIADFWNRISAMQPGDYISSADLGQWALNVIDRDATTRITVADFRATTAAMQASMDRAGHAPAGATPTPITAFPTPVPITTPPPAVATIAALTTSTGPYGTVAWHWTSPNSQTGQYTAFVPVGSNVPIGSQPGMFWYWKTEGTIGDFRLNLPGLPIGDYQIRLYDSTQNVIAFGNVISIHN